MGTLFIGGGFFVGYEIAGRLVQDGHDLTVIALQPPPEEIREHVEWLQLDRNDAPELRKHLAGRKFDLVFDNVAFNPAHVETLLQALDGRTDRFFLTSTIDLYLKAHPRVFFEYQGQLDPSDQEGTTLNERYLRGKRGCEKVIRASGLAWTVIRPCVVTGRRDNQSCAPARSGISVGEPSRSLFYPCRVRDGAPILLRQDDEAAFNLIWVADLAKAISALLQARASIGEAYNVAGDEVWTSERLILMMLRAAGRPPDIVRVSPTLLAPAGLSDYQPPYGLGPVWSIVENQKLRSLGWRPTAPETWMADLIEAAPSHFVRGWYERRLREIALAHYVRRQRTNLLPLDHVTPPASQDIRSVTRGQIRAEANERWLRQALRSDAEQITRDLHEFRGVRLSRFGLGTWRGDPGFATDAKYIGAILHAVKNGINVIDTAINYRAMQAERCVGRALRQLQHDGFDRSMVLVCTKGGFIPHDCANNLPYDRYVKTRYVDKALVSSDEANRRHSIQPKFIRYLLDQSLNNLCVKHVDVYYLHNPETALEFLDPDTFYSMLAQTFEVLEEAAANGQIGCYGLATWYGLHVPPSDKRHLSLARAVEIARSRAGADHHFRAVQMPYSAVHPAARTSASQEVNGRLVSAFEAARELGLYCFTSASVGQGHSPGEALVQQLRATCPALRPHGAMLRLAASTPGIGTALVGMREVTHVNEAIAIAKMPPLDIKDIDAILQQAAQTDTGGPHSSPLATRGDSAAKVWTGLPGKKGKKRHRRPIAAPGSRSPDRHRGVLPDSTDEDLPAGTTSQSLTDGQQPRQSSLDNPEGAERSG
jgi:aryl-alcohol dehydrogenase-like predicted oxidoreductase/nucleoside-diphosphate-sugar epimerase